MKTNVCSQFWLAKCWMVIWTIIAAVFFSTGANSWFSTSSQANGYLIHAQNIEDIRVGQRVHTNQMEDAPSTNQLDIKPAEWRVIHLEMPIEGAETVYDIHVLRPLSWLFNLSSWQEAQIPFELDEIGVRGLARIISVEICPPISPGKGRLVLGTIVSQSDQVLEITVNGSNKPLQPTRRHQIFSDTRNDWVAAGELKVGERLRTQSGVVTITNLKAKPGRHKVYNLEVEQDHRYFVSDYRVLSHNTGANPCAAPPPDDFIDVYHGSINHSTTIHANGLSTGKGSATYVTTDIRAARNAVSNDRYDVSSGGAKDIGIVVARIPKSQFDEVFGACLNPTPYKGFNSALAGKPSNEYRLGDEQIEVFNKHIIKLIK